MSLTPLPALLDATLRTVARRYRLPPLERASSLTDATNPATALAIVIEEARRVRADGHAPGADLRQRFIDALARMIRDAMDTSSGDPSFQASVLRHDAPNVREYASLSAHAEQDRRALHSAVNAIAHPAKLERSAQAWQRDGLARLHAAATAASWAELHAALAQLLALPEMATDAAFEQDIVKLKDGPALERMLRLDALAADEDVRRYRALWVRQGPLVGSTVAVAQGAASQQRGAAVEALAAQALDALARRLDAVDAQRTYRVVTSMRVPSSIPGRHDRAKTEWDAILLERARGSDPASAWNVRFLVEAKASADAATTDLPRLLRGLTLLAQAAPDTVYAFETHQGTVHVHGASLHALTTDETTLPREVLYCCDASADTTPRLLGAASRMQLLSAQASLEYASALAQQPDADPDGLGVIWHALLTLPQWQAVLHQYPSLRQVRELMVAIDDLRAAIEDIDEGGIASSVCA
ncbi:MULTISPECIES: 3-deoxy-D-arabino-heptulosonate 7-phosphate synthase [Burkholderia]|uniref:3-deoxy-D-arabino-heptulosonate 7-phosphate synthase n=1 Tax=Burkholderia TaxID=32008 RepID=UPI00098243C8|nr:MULTISPECIES: 3-deoxy-D-arabino-heptulosonate 7-phosphate synthase [Burkholderia]AQQ40299.1 3-deoxy-D-arabino-heptulosonate 7-phosphate synthase [Burkholderia cenocepacia]MBG0880078.1 3-deoxy-D-arabino-heptulosonate 7-phosphate synthase [Burkholderia sp. 9775_39]MBG0887530.1 3-deoxy-D-arabino-heptulosonate 7-phosphate synthase [Burkholderia sp. 9773_38]ONV27008.1 3-deoxy-D-arabino-heptulosonate 7-phosphate synthase [Burkholderia cenocepacia]ONV34245.1 3-deoxy-D-arabino-heptulosonate 7-phosp